MGKHESIRLAEKYLQGKFRRLTLPTYTLDGASNLIWKRATRSYKISVRKEGTNHTDLHKSIYVKDSNQTRELTEQFVIGSKAKYCTLKRITRYQLVFKYLYLDTYNF